MAAAAFESINRPGMKALPSSRYELADWKDAKVNIDYHVDYDGRFYSVDHTLIGAQVEIRATSSTIEILSTTGFSARQKWPASARQEWST